MTTQILEKEKEIERELEISDNTFKLALALAATIVKKNRKIDLLSLRKEDIKLYEKTDGNIAVKMNYLANRGKKPDDYSDNVVEVANENGTSMFDVELTSNVLRAKKLDDKVVYKKLGTPLDVELQKRFKEYLTKHNLKMKDVLKKEIENWMNNPDSIEFKKYELKKRKNNGFMVEEDFKKRFLLVLRENNRKQTEVLESIIENVLSREEA